MCVCVAGAVWLLCMWTADRKQISECELARAMVLEDWMAWMLWCMAIAAVETNPSSACCGCYCCSGVMLCRFDCTIVWRCRWCECLFAIVCVLCVARVISLNDDDFFVRYHFNFSPARHNVATWSPFVRCVDVMSIQPTQWRSSAIRLLALDSRNLPGCWTFKWLKWNNIEAKHIV